jgi:hypothetical protein
MNELLKNKLILPAFLCLGLLAASLPAYAQEKIKFRDVVEKKLDTMKWQTGRIINGKPELISQNLEKVCPIDKDSVANRVFTDYGAIFISENGVVFPFKCVFEDESEVSNYQKNAKPKSANIGGVTIELQEPAMNALLKAVEQAKKENLRISPRGGATAAKRSYADTSRLWDSRFYPALNYWVGKGKISRQAAEAAKLMSIKEQVAQVLEWESKRLWFSTDFSKSILYSVAAPGASQHIFMLALDVEQFSNKRVREILADNGWFQTVKSDLPHFTYLGLESKDLEKKGLKLVPSGGQQFWIPNFD